MKELNLSTKRGKEVYIMGSSCGFTDIRDLYKNPSKAKKEAFEKCWLEYVNDVNSQFFGVGNENSFGFTCSWLTLINNENVMIVKTRCNDYLVWLER